MEITQAHARELEKQKLRKAELRAECEAALSGTNRILFEAGCGHGHWLTSYAEENLAQTCVGIDLISWRIRKGRDKRDKRQLQNLHFFKAELGEFLEVLPERIRFDMTVLLFPDPWPKAKHHRRRMVQTGFLDEVARRTDVGGRFCFRSDDLPYYEWTVEHLQAHPEWQIDAQAEWPHEMETYFQEMMESYHSVVAHRVLAQS
jgi:tRNA (guanine-N7-)-methyltransferase